MPALIDIFFLLQYQCSVHVIQTPLFTLNNVKMHSVYWSEVGFEQRRFQWLAYCSIPTPLFWSLLQLFFKCSFMTIFDLLLIFNFSRINCHFWAGLVKWPFLMYCKIAHVSVCFYIFRTLCYAFVKCDMSIVRFWFCEFVYWFSICRWLRVHLSNLYALLIILL